MPPHFCLGIGVPRHSATVRVLLVARAMMHDDVYRACALLALEPASQHKLYMGIARGGLGGSIEPPFQMNKIF